MIQRALTGLTLFWLGSQAAHAQSVWSGQGVAFAKDAFVDSSLPANQDRLTPMTWITRADTQGLFNIKSESSFGSGSPANTEWAYDFAGNGNTGLSITAANHAALSFESWQDAVNSNPPGSVGVPGVLHLIAEDIYVDIQFTSWGVSGSAGGSFAYLRGGPPAMQSSRSAGTNPASLSASNPVLGSSMMLSVDLATTGHSMSALFLYDTTIQVLCPGGQALLVGGSLVADFGLRSGPIANYSLAIPNDMTLAGMSLSFQAVHLMGVVPFALSNALDVTAGF